MLLFGKKMVAGSVEKAEWKGVHKVCIRKAQGERKFGRGWFCERFRFSQVTWEYIDL